MSVANKSNLIFFCFILFLNSTNYILPVNNVEDSIATKLENYGFENIIAIAETERVIVSYENRLYRDEVDAIRKVIELIAPGLTEYTYLVLLPQNMNIPLCEIVIDINKYIEFLSEKITREVFVESLGFSLEPDDLWEHIRKTQRTNKTELKTDIIIYPQLKTRHGDYEKLIQVQAGISPILQTMLGRGISIFAQMIIPFYDNLSNDSDFIRPGILAFNATFRLPKNIFMSTTLGQFANVDRYGIKWEHRYGIDWEIKKYFDDGVWSIGANLGYTGESSYKDRIWKLKTMSTFTYFINAGYRIEKYNLNITAKYGQFIYEDKGLRLDVNRKFGEVEIGFYTILSSDIKNGGFNIAIPIFPSKYYSSPIRILPSKYFEYEYRAKRLPREGQMYETGYSIDNFRKGLSRDYIKSFLFN